MAYTAHMLNTRMRHVINGLERTHAVRKDIDVVKEIVTGFRKSGWMQGLADGYSPIKEAKTRSGTTHDVLERFVNSVGHVQDILTAKDLQGAHAASKLIVKFSSLTQTTSTNGLRTFTALLAVIEVFLPLTETKIALESTSTPLLHTVLPQLEHAKHDPISISGTLARDLATKTHEVIGIVMHVHHLLFATSLLHPGLRTLGFVSDKQKWASARQSGLTLLRRVRGDDVKRSIRVPQHFTSFDPSSAYDFSRSLFNTIASYMNEPMSSLVKKQLNAPFGTIQYWLLVGEAKRIFRLGVCSLAHSCHFDYISAERAGLL